MIDFSRFFRLPGRSVVDEVNQGVQAVEHATRTIAPGTPILFSESVGSDMESNLFPGVGGSTPHGLNFQFFATGMSLFSNQQTRGIYAVDLPFSAGVHLLGLPVHTDTPVPVGVINGLDPVQLEGTYNQIFRLYAEPNEQVQSRYVLNPSAMAFTEDFCSNFNWEILNDTLYFMDAEHFPTFAVVDEFVEKIRPAIEVAAPAAKNPYAMSYTETVGRTMLCPICQQKLVTGAAWLACPQGHGCLVTGKQLLEMKQRTEPAPTDETNLVSHGQLTCPYCQNPMVATQYQETNITIDVCSKCMFRWLDANEPTALFSREPIV